MGKPYAYSPGATYAIYNLIPESSIDFKLSPVMLMKAKKNDLSHEIHACLQANKGTRAPRHHWPPNPDLRLSMLAETLQSTRSPRKN